MTAESFDRSWQRHHERLVEANALNKAAVFEALSAAGITDVIVDFDGEGDSGQINNIAAQADGAAADLPATSVTIHTVTWGATVAKTHQCPLAEAIEQLCYDYLAQEHDGWENNDGAYGEFHLDVRARTLALDFNARFTDVYNTTHMF